MIDHVIVVTQTVGIRHREGIVRSDLFGVMADMGVIQTLLVGH